MVCDKCEKKLGKVITPDVWKSGARNTTEGGGRKVIYILILFNLIYYSFTKLLDIKLKSCVGFNKLKDICH